MSEKWLITVRTRRVEVTPPRTVGDGVTVGEPEIESEVIDCHPVEWLLMVRREEDAWCARHPERGKTRRVDGIVFATKVPKELYDAAEELWAVA